MIKLNGTDKDMGVASRPAAWLRRYGRLYPQAWSELEAYHRARGVSLPSWPAWCHVPVAGAYAVVANEMERQTGVWSIYPGRGEHVGHVAALGAWRLTKGVYRFDETLFEEILATPATGTVPLEVLQRLPEWCVYVALPERNPFEGRGFFAHLEHDMSEKHAELRIVVDHDDPDRLQLHPIHLVGSVREGVEASVRYTERWSPRPPGFGAREIDRWVAYLEPLVSLLLYVCSVNAEIGNPLGHLPRHVSPVKTKRGLMYFGAEKVRVWDVGVRIGAALRRARAAERIDQVPDLPEGRTNRSPRAHVRRAHWHTYWTGPRHTSQVRVIKWIPPLAVAFGETGTPDGLPTVVRAVESA